MKKLLVTALFGAFAVAQETAPTDAPSNHSIFYAVDADYRLDGNQFEGEHFVKYTYKYADGYKLMPAASFFTNYSRADKNAEWHDEVTHQFLRVELDTPKFWDILGFKTGVRVRYNVPTGTKDEGYGVVSPRLIMEKEFNSHFNLTVIPKLSFYLQRNGYNRASGDRNSLVRAGVEIVPQWKFNEDLTLTYDLDVGGSYKGDSAAGEDNLFVVGDFYQEIEFMYNVSALGDLGLGLIAINEGNFGNHEEQMLLNDEETFVGLRIQKGFDL